MSFGQIVLLVYGLLMIVGGLMGYRAGSRVSLIAGGSSGVALLVAFAASLRFPVAGFWAGAVIGVALTGVFIRRVSATGKMMPSGALAGVSVIAWILLILAAVRA